MAQFGRRLMPPGLWEGSSDLPWIALTIDDGPDPALTPRLLNELRKVDAPASFFVVGDRAEQTPDLVRRIHAEGHEIGNHTWNHRPLAMGACRSPREQVGRTEELLAKLCPGTTRLFRPPFGAIGPGGGRALAREGLLPIYWSVVPGDWDPLSPSEIRRRVMREAHPGAVVVLHGGRPWHAGTAASIGDLVRELRDAGYEVVSLAKMLAGGGLTAGVR
jgi:peptidoglycan/xylan/chitin deacetylase (PgdA/CDA1 family)